MCVPLALKWLRKQGLQNSHDLAPQSRIVSALAVGPHQRVVTVEVGAQDARVRLTLGVTAQAISLLHTQALAGAVDTATVSSLSAATVDTK